MKKYLFLATALLGGLVACQRENMPETIVPEDSTITFAATMPSLKAEEGTKTEWTGETLQWSANDQIRMAYTVEGVWQGASDESTTPKLYASTRLSEATHYAEFNVNTNFKSTATGTHVFYGLYPGELVSGTDFSKAPVVSITIPAEQTPAAASFDAAADVMVGVSEEWDKKPESGETVLLTWTRQVAHADLTIKNLAINEGETISSITLTAQNGADLVGMHDIDITTGEVSNPQGTTNEIVVKTDNLVYANNTIEVWVSMLPVTITDLKVCVETDKATYTRSFTGITREFKKNMRNTMNIGMSAAVREEIATDLTDYEESFSASFGDFTINNSNLPEELTYVWSLDSQYHYAKGSAYAGKPYEATSYLLSPELEIGSKNSKLTFSQAANQLKGAAFGDYFTVVVFEGENETALELDVVPAGTNWTFVNTTVDLSSYFGKTIKIGFKYTSSSSVAGTWEIKNFKVTDVKIQESTAPTIEVADVTIAAEGVEGSKINPTVTNMDDIEVEVFADEALTTECEWITFDLDTTIPEVTFSAEANEETTPRYAYFHFKVFNEAGESVEKTMKLTQEGAMPSDLTPVAKQSIDFTAMGYTNGQEIGTIDGTNCSIVFDKGTNSNVPKYYTSGTAIRVYGGGTITVSADEGYVLNTIEFTFGSSDGSNAITASTGTYSNGKWTGNATEVVFTIGGASGNRRFTAIAIN